MKRIMDEEIREPDAYLIKRKLWVALAHDQIKRRKRYLGSEFVKPCKTCVEILMCSGPIGKHICSTINDMLDDGLLLGPKRIPIDKRRAKLLPISRECLEAYGILKQKSSPLPSNTEGD